MPRALYFPLSICFLCWLVTSAAGEDFTPAEQTRAEFQQICDAFRSGDDPYFGTQIVDQLRGMLARPARDPVVRVGRRARLGVELLRLGETNEALARLTEARELADSAEFVGARWDEIRRRLRRDLALAWLRAAEERNCVENHTGASCIVPLLPEAVHRDPEPASRAAELYDELLARSEGGGDATLVWLRAVARATAGIDDDGPPWLSGDDVDFPRWRQVGMSVGLHRRDLAGGAAMDDFDGDGDLDLISSTNDPCGSMTALRNDGPPGDLDAAAFVDVTEAWGLDAQWGGLNFVHADADGDGGLDLYVLRGGWWNEYGEVRNSLLLNQLAEGHGFVDVTRAAGLDGPGAPAAPTQTAAFADADGDGDLDLFVGHEATPGRPYRSRLYRNVSRSSMSQSGRVRFEDATAEAGVQNLLYAKGATWGDFDDDGDPDLYVSNLGGPNRLYRNDSSRDSEGELLRFVDVAEEMGVTEPMSSFATWFFDADSDGDSDLFVADYSAPYSAVHASLLGAQPGGEDLGAHPRLFLNRRSQGGAGFDDASEAWGLVQPALPMGANLGDIDSDGRPDLYLGTGVPDYEALMPNVMLRNTGDRFEDVTYAGGFGHLQKGHGVAFGDLDGDGDEDLFHQLGGQYPGDVYTNALFENPGSAAARHLTLRLRGVAGNPFMVGARITVTVRTGEGLRVLHSVVGTGGSFGGNSHLVELGLGSAREIVSMDVRWPSSTYAVSFRGLEPGSVYVLTGSTLSQDEPAGSGAERASTASSEQ